MSVAAKPMTAEEFAKLEPDSFNDELICGEVVRMPPHEFHHARIVAAVGSALTQYVSVSSLGMVGSGGGFRLQRDPDTVLAPDVAFVRGDAVKMRASASGYPDIAPALVVEVVSPSDRAQDIERKVELYLGTGVEMVVVIWPLTKHVTVHEPNGRVVKLSEHDTFDGGDVVSGFTLPVKSIFA